MVLLDVRGAAAEGPLSRLPPQALTRLLDGHTVLRCAAGGVLYRPGETVGVHLVEQGLIRVSLVSEEGRQLTVRYARRGDVLGVPVAVRGGVPVYAQAVTDATVVTTRPGVLRQLAQADPRVGLWMTEELAARVDGLLHELASNAFWPVRRRLARHLLDLAVDDQEGRRELVVRASRQELADHVGTVREVVARTLGSFRDGRLVDLEADGIRLLRPDDLADLP